MLIDIHYDVTSRTGRLATVVVLAALVAGLAGCASRKTVNGLDADLRGLASEVAAIQARERSQTPAAARLQGDLRVLESRLVEITTTVRDASVEMGRLRARLEATEEALRAARAPAGAATPSTEPRAAGAPDRVAAPADTPEAIFSAALATFQAREHGQAVLEFLDFIGRYPTHPLAASAQYWIGEAYYLQRDCRQALVEFKRVVDAPPNPHVPDALVKMGLCHGTLRQPTRARELWQRVVREHAQSEAAERARALLRPSRNGPRP